MERKARKKSVVEDGSSERATYSWELVLNLCEINALY